jgi:hypothetical protein
VRLCVGLFGYVCMSVHVVPVVREEGLDIEKNNMYLIRMAFVNMNLYT